MNLNELFNDYIEEFKKLDTKDKRKHLIGTTKELLDTFEELAHIDNIKINYLKSNEVISDDEDISEEEFLKRELIYLEAAKNVIGQYLQQKNV